MLYAHSHSGAFGEVKRGRGRARFWRKRYVAYEVDGWRINSLRDMVSDLSPEEAYENLRLWAEWVTDCRGNLASVTSTSWSIWRRTLPRKILLASNSMPMPRDDFIIGGRQEANSGVYDEAESWDINGAYQSAMRTMLVGARYRRTGGERLRMENTTFADCVGFARAHVYLTNVRGEFGPIPAGDGKRISFPSSGVAEGIFDLEELRLARECGATVIILEAWIGRGLRLPWRAWSDVMEEGRRLPGRAGKIAKTMANSLWGSFAVTGRGSWIDYFQGKARVVLDEREVTAPCRPLSAHISAHVRARLYREALQFWSAGPFCISAHTDGAIFQTPAYPSGPIGGALGEWRRKYSMRDLTLVNAQAYRFVDANTGRIKYVVAGTPPEYAERVFRAILRKAGDRATGVRPRRLLDFGAWTQR